MAIYDVFPFFNELDLLEIRLNIMDPYVDYFIITEATKTFSGKAKPLYYEKHKDRFVKFKDKIIYQVVDDMPDSSTGFERDWYQRDKAKEVLTQLCKSNDLIIYSDLDEIPNPNRLPEVFDRYPKFQAMTHFAQDPFFVFLNLIEKSGKTLSYAGEYPKIRRKKWIGTNVSTWEYAQHFSMTNLRDPSHKGKGLRCANGGWHFSYVGSHNELSAEERVKLKIQSSAHEEVDTPSILNGLAKKIRKNKDILGRKGLSYKVLKDFSYLPEYLQNNLDKYNYLFTK